MLGMREIRMCVSTEIPICLGVFMERSGHHIIQLNLTENRLQGGLEMLWSSTIRACSTTMGTCCTLTPAAARGGAV
jgi:hypothetical protein